MLVRNPYLAREAAELDRTGDDCYAATSSRFLAAGGSTQPEPLLDTRAIAVGRPRPRWPGGAPLAVCLTHDVDNVAWFNARMHARRIGSQLRCLSGRPLQRRAWGALKSTAFALARSIDVKRREDPLHGYERWLDLEAAHGAKSTFFFLPDRYPRAHFSDGGYRYHDAIKFAGRRCRVAEMIGEISRRGWEVGLHASWYAGFSANQMRGDRQRLEQAAQAMVRSVRQHFLHCDPRHAPAVYQQAGLLNDSSFGFNDGLGFRHRTSYPYFLPSGTDQPNSGVLEVPLAIQDRCLTGPRGKAVDIRAAIDRGLNLAGQVQAVSGVLTILWHPRLIADDDSMAVYTGLLERLKDLGAWFATIGEVAEWWRQHQKEGVPPSRAGR